MIVSLPRASLRYNISGDEEANNALPTTPLGKGLPIEQEQFNRWVTRGSRGCHEGV